MIDDALSKIEAIRYDLWSLVTIFIYKFISKQIWYDSFQP